MRQSLGRSMKFLLAAALACGLALWPIVTAADTVAVTGGEANGQQGDGSMSPAARAAMMHGALPASAADVAAKAAANRAYDAAVKRGALLPLGASDVAALGGGSASQAPVIVSPIPGQRDAGGAPPDTTGATGTTRYVQTVNSRFMIVNRENNVTLSSGTLNRLAGWGAAVNSFDPQVIWDPTTRRFYYAMDSVFSSTDNRIAFGFSKSSSPNTAADWCKYFVEYGSLFPDYPKLGDNQHFVLIGVNTYNSLDEFIRSDLLVLTKPVGTGTISTCPTFTALMNGRSANFTDLRDTTDQPVFSPTPANSIDTLVFGYVVARNLAIPATKLWIIPVNETTGGQPRRLPARVVTIPATPIPPDAAQPVVTQKLDTSDTRMTQAVLSRNPLRSNTLSLWTQQTIANGATGSQIRYYEIRPDLTAPVLRRTGLISAAGAFLFNAAISSDRRVDGAIAANGGSFLITFNATKVSAPAVFPRIRTGSSVLGAAPTFTTVKESTGPYRDFTCAGAGQTCRWGDYSGATPDPRPRGSASAVGFTNQYASGNTAATQSNWRTWIWHARP